MYIKPFALTLLFTLVSLLASADPVEIDGFWYNLDSNHKTAEVAQMPYGRYSGAIDIPEKVTYEGAEYSVTSIENKAFYTCTSLTSVTIPNSVTNIGLYAFQECTSLTSVTIPNSVTSIGGYAFYLCSGLTSVTIGNSVTSIGEVAFRGCTSLTSITIPNSVTSIGDQAFYGCSSLTSVTIPNSVTSIGEYVFSNCTGLTSVTIGNNLTCIERGTFASCSSLTSVTIGNSVKNIYISAFHDCTSLTSVSIPNSVTSIGDYAFNGCSGLTSITIGSGIRKINSCAFAKCSNLTDVTCMAENMPQTAYYAFEDSPIDKATLHVPDASVNLYKEAEPWKNFMSIAGMTTSVAQIKVNAVLIQSEGGRITVNGVDDGTNISVYGTDGVLRDTAISRNGSAAINTNLQTGSVVIVKIGENPVKVVVK